jgi:predicted  nucleic acid-binding Zn-ribbon protein
LFLIVVVSGGIAYAADKLGKKLGKKRLSVFGLRPKHTAALGTVLLGMAVSLLTIGLVAALSKDARDWITQGSQALARLKKAQASLLVQEDELRSVQSQRDEAQAKILSAVKELKTINQQVQAQKSQIAALQGRLAPLQARLAQISAAVKIKDAQISAAKSRLAASQKSLAENEQRVATLEGNVKKVNARYQAGLKLLDTEERQIETADRQIGTQKTQIAEQTRKLSTMKTDLDKGEAELASETSQLTDITARLTNLNVSYNHLEVTYSQLQNHFVQLQGQDQQLTQIFLSWVGPSRELPLICRIRQEVCRLELPAGMPLEDARQGFDHIMDMARTAAVKLGAHQQGKESVADVYGRPDGTTADKIEEQTIHQLTHRQDEVVLIAYAAMNTFYSEPLPLDFGVFDNPLVYPKGQVVKDGPIDGQKSADQIVQQLNTFARSLQSKAIFDKMIPKLNDSEPLGSLTTSEVLRLMTEIKAQDRTVKLEVIARSDIRAADPLDVDFRVR